MLYVTSLMLERKICTYTDIRHLDDEDVGMLSLYTPRRLAKEVHQIIADADVLETTSLNNTYNPLNAVANFLQYQYLQYSDYDFDWYLLIAHPPKLQKKKSRMFRYSLNQYQIEHTIVVRHELCYL